MAAEDQSSSQLTRVTQVFGLFAGAAVILYITGGVVLALRLGFDNLPYDAVVGQLPREFLISQGLGLVVLPAAAGAALYVVYRLIRREPKQPTLGGLSSTGSSSERRTWKYWWSLVEDLWKGWKVLLVAAVASAVLIAPALAHELIKQKEWRWGLLWFVLAFVLTFVNMIAVLQIRALIVQKHFKWEEERGNWNKPGVVATMAALYAAAIVPGAIAFGATVPLLDAKVCRTSGSYEVGSLIGETSDKVYLGLGEAKHNDREIVVIPYDQVRQVLAGGHAEDESCPPPEAKAPQGEPASGVTGPTGATGAMGPRGTPGP